MTRTAPTNLSQVLASPGTNELREIKPPVSVPGGWEWVLWVFGGVLLAVLLYLAWRYWQKRRSHAPKVPEIPAHIRAQKRFEEALSLIGNPREFCIVVSDTVRWYLEERFDFRAPDRTTEEFLLELRGTPLLKAAQKESLGRFLESCDLVKFAKYEPAEPELRDLHRSAVLLVEETKPVAPVTPAGQWAAPAAAGAAPEPAAEPQRPGTPQ